MTDIVDPRTSESEVTDVQVLEELKTILPYFPDDERMGRYLCYISSGWTRKEARIRAGLSYDDYKACLSDDRFREIDSLPYNELREKVANAYAELKIRRNAISWLEFDEEFAVHMQQKIASGEELTKDERALFLKRASIYGPETVMTANKLITGQNDEESGSDSGNFDIAVFVRSRKAQ